MASRGLGFHADLATCLGVNAMSTKSAANSGNL